MSKEFNSVWLAEHEAKQAVDKRTEDTVNAAIATRMPKILERSIHDKIIAFCNEQHPRWKFIHARMDQKTTIEVGAPDFVIFASRGRTFIIEVKRPGGKHTTTQLAWAMESGMNGHPVKTVYSYEEFLEHIK